MAKVLSFFIAVFLFLGGIPYGFQPTIVFDVNNTDGEVLSGACGFLYGLAVEGVPSEEMIKSLDISSVSQKVVKGLQHPVGDISEVADELVTCDYLTVYLQDAYSTWYYDAANIEQMKDEGTYDCVAYVNDDFLPKAMTAVEYLSAQSYSDRIVYCPFNECDNAVWFGTRTEEGWNAFDDAAKLRFYEGWKTLYNAIREINPAALIGGPGYCDYDIAEITDFLIYCKENSCLPDIMIYHELNEYSSLFWCDHIEEYREKEAELGINEIPIIITEYGTMQECGNPAGMLHYISEIEKSHTYANIAFWRLADNLCDTCTDANVPNSAWWLYKWYSDMDGELINANVVDVLHSDFANTIKYARSRFHYKNLTGLGSVNKDGSIEMLVGGSDYDFSVILRNLSFRQAHITIEAVTFEGISGAVYSPTVIADYAEKTYGKLKVNLPQTDNQAVYHITVTEGECDEYKTATSLPERFEAENGTLIGNSYTYDSAYATTGEIAGMCGGFENEGDGIEIPFSVADDGEYTISLVYGNSNDGSTPADRCDTDALMKLDGEEKHIFLPNTIKSEYTDKYSFNTTLSAGEHTLTLMHSKGTFVIDSILVSSASTDNTVYSEYCDGYDEYLVVAPTDDYYSIHENSETRYLKRGLNYIPAKEKTNPTVTTAFCEDYLTIAPHQLECAGTASLSDNNCITGIAEGRGAVRFTTVVTAGEYALTVTYSNNQEGGVHDYNVDLIEAYITVSVGNKSYNLPCVNTQAESNLNTAVCYITLEDGENIIELGNDGHRIFNGQPAISPDIYGVTLNPVTR